MGEKAISAKKAGQDRLEQKKEFLDKRNRWFCFTATEWLEKGKHEPSEIVGILEKLQIKEFQNRSPIGAKQIRRILHNGNVPFPKGSSKNS